MENTTIISEDNDGNGTPEKLTETVTKTVKGSSHNPTVTTSVYEDLDQDGNFDTVVRTIKNDCVLTTEKGAISYDSDGNQIIEFIVDKYSDDAIIKKRVETINDKDNSVLIEEYNQLNGPVVKRVKEIYNEDDQIIERRSDEDLNGSFEQTTAYEYDQNGNNTLILTTRSNDTIERVENTFDENGYVIQKHTISTESGGSNITKTFDYNEKGLIRNSKIVDNVTEEMKNQTFEYNGKGHKIKELVDADLDGNIDYYYDLGVNDQCQRTSYLKTLADGTKEMYVEYEYLHGDLVYSLRDKNVDGNLDYIYTYDNFDTRDIADKPYNLDSFYSFYIYDDNATLSIDEKFIESVNKDFNVTTYGYENVVVNLPRDYSVQGEPTSDGYTKYADEHGHSINIDPEITVLTTL
ncbi:hypothetical protein QJU23_10575 [Pasteurella atlantica]|uniref:Uncharacterized protein n=2 Tax=Pasteurellaceae TaxID=712 RepID=A0ACC6HQ38_9PAST|nr:hypothetical protein [Pasteurella atlantica]MDP8052856.1 hypothetical protein [Pasteurella atlantica]MDP8106123.1 hypothetical protein [Pasteurella atlantica]